MADKTKAFGTTLSYLPTYDNAGAVVAVGALTSVGEIAPSADEIDVTALDSTGGYKEFLQGFKDSGEVSITGFHDISDTGQIQMRTLFGTGATGYFWVTFPDLTIVAMTAFVKSYKAGPSEVNGAVGFGATLRVTGLVQVTGTAVPIAKAVTVGAVTGSMISTATAITGTPTYQWYSSATNVNTGGSLIAGATSATFAIPADMDAGVHYFYCVISVTGYRAIPSRVHIVTAT